jgi:hypothetical protein
MTMNLPANSDDDLDSLMEEYLSRLKRVHQKLTVELEKIESIMRAIQGDCTSVDPNSKKAPSIKMMKMDPSQLKDASWGDLILWGLSQIGGAGTLSEVANQVAQLPLEHVQQRVANFSLPNVLRVNAETLCYNHRLKKIENSKRKGGIMYQLID